MVRTPRRCRFSGLKNVSLCERSLSEEPVGEQAGTEPVTPSVVVLSDQELATSVRQALRDYTRPAALASNPLVRSRLVADVAGDVDGASALQAVLRQALETLKPSPKDEKFYRALLYTLFQPAATQEGAAECLACPSAPTGTTSPAAPSGSSNRSGTSSYSDSASNHQSPITNRTVSVHAQRLPRNTPPQRAIQAKSIFMK